MDRNSRTTARALRGVILVEVTRNHMAPPESDISILRINELAAALRVSEMTIQRLVKRGEMPAPMKLGPRIIGWPREMILRWICERFEAANAAKG
ncbi:MAG: AlpA family phage regulatory protein [Acidobacteriaceae bacterium]|nr:AlpA family phage regulatory protein [Acidobacteriaceae bacterium]